MEQFKVVITSDADKDMDEIFEYISQKLHVPNAAANLVERIYNALKYLSAMPKRFPLSRDSFLAKQGFHILPIVNYLAFYVVDSAKKRVIVHRVISGKRNYTKLFLSSEQYPEEDIL